jgi:hypothetical protein
MRSRSWIEIAMKAIDFTRARIAWTTHDGSRGLWRVVAAARREDDGAAWFLAAGVMAGDVYGQDRLPLQPAYSFQFVASRDRHVMLREAVDAADVHDSEAPHSAAFKNLAIDVPEIDAETLPLDRIVAQSRWPLTAQLSAAGADGNRWALEFPVSHINLRDHPVAWQVETGPVVVPCDLIDIAGAAKTGGVQLACVFFNRADRADLLAFGPSGDSRRGFVRVARLENIEVALLA